MKRAGCTWTVLVTLRYTQKCPCPFKKHDVSILNGSKHSYNTTLNFIQFKFIQVNRSQSTFLSCPSVSSSILAIWSFLNSFHFLWKWAFYLVPRPLFSSVLLPRLDWTAPLKRPLDSLVLAADIQVLALADYWNT